MIPTFLGVIVALIVIAWGVRWYFTQTAREWPSMLDSSTSVVPTSLLDAPLMEPEAAEQFMQRELKEDKEIALVDRELEVGIKNTAQRSEIVIDSVRNQSIPILVSPTMAQIKLDVARRNAKDRQGRVMGFCAHCRQKREVSKPSLTRTKKGKSAIRGHCVQCGSGMFIFTLE